MLQVTPASVLTLWATVVAERLDYPPDLALTLGQAVAVSSARTKAGSNAVARNRDREADKREQELLPALQTVWLLGQEIVLTAADDDEWRADDYGQPASASSVELDLQEAFGDHLSEVWATMTAVAATIPPEELNRVGFCLYEYFRPDVPAGAQGRDEKGELLLIRIEAAGAGGPIQPAGMTQRRRHDQPAVRNPTVGASS